MENGDQILQELRATRHMRKSAADAMAQHEHLISPAELGEWLGKSPAALANWRYKGIGPKFVKVGKLIRYRTSDVETWLEENTRTQT